MRGAPRYHKRPCQSRGLAHRASPSRTGWLQERFRDRDAALVPWGATSTMRTWHRFVVVALAATLEACSGDVTLGAPAASGTTSGAGGSSSASSGAGGSPESTCGGELGTPCPEGFYCDYADNGCGFDDGRGT